MCLSLLVLRGKSRRRATDPPPDISASHRDALDLRLRLFALGQGDGKHAILEAGVDLVLLHVETDGDMALEAAVEAFGEMAVLVLGLGPLLDAQRRHTVIEQDLDILFAPAGDHRSDADVLVGLSDLYIWPTAAAERGQAAVDAAEDVVEAPVHLPVKREEGAPVGLAADRWWRGSPAAPGN